MFCSLPCSSVHRISRQEYWRGLPFPSSGDLPDPGMEPVKPVPGAKMLETATLDEISAISHSFYCQFSVINDFIQSNKHMTSNHFPVKTSLPSQVYLGSWDMVKFLNFSSYLFTVSIPCTRLHLATPELKFRKERDTGQNSLLDYSCNLALVPSMEDSK